MSFASRPGHRAMCPCAECDGRSAAPAVPVGVQPEPAEERMDCGLMSLAGWLDGCLDGVGRTDVSSETWLREFKAATPAVPVVHPEPAPESSDSVAELVAGTTRSGDRAVPLVDHAYVEGPYAYCHKCGNHRNAHPALEEL